MSKPQKVKKELIHRENSCFLRFPHCLRIPNALLIQAHCLLVASVFGFNVFAFGILEETGTSQPTKLLPQLAPKGPSPSKITSALLLSFTRVVCYKCTSLSLVHPTVSSFACGFCKSLNAVRTQISQFICGKCGAKVIYQKGSRPFNDFLLICH